MKPTAKVYPVRKLEFSKPSDFLEVLETTLKFMDDDIRKHQRTIQMTPFFFYLYLTITVLYCYFGYLSPGLIYGLGETLQFLLGLIRIVLCVLTLGATLGYLTISQSKQHLDFKKKSLHYLENTANTMHASGGVNCNKIIFNNLLESLRKKKNSNQRFPLLSTLNKYSGDKNE